MTVQLTANIRLNSFFILFYLVFSLRPSVKGTVFPKEHDSLYVLYYILFPSKCASMPVHAWQSNRACPLNKKSRRNPVRLDFHSASQIPERNSVCLCPVKDLRGLCDCATSSLLCPDRLLIGRYRDWACHCCCRCPNCCRACCWTKNRYSSDPQS